MYQSRICVVYIETDMAPCRRKAAMWLQSWVPGGEGREREERGKGSASAIFGAELYFNSTSIEIYYCICIKIYVVSLNM